MRFTIKHKLFLTLLLATLAVVAIMIVVIKWSFERGFLEYVNKVEQEVHSNLVINLADAYKENGSWDFIRENPRQWYEIHRSSMPVSEEVGGHRHHSRNPGMYDKKREGGPKSLSERGHRPPPRGKHRRGKVCLLDENKRAITHCRDNGEELKLREIVVDDKKIGYLASSPRKKLSQEHDLHFSQKQHRFLLLLGLCIALVSVLVALPVSRQLIKPIKILADATRKLAAGQYQARVNVDSSDELGDLSRDFNSLAITLESNEQARKQWIADISHELRTPLSVLRGEIEALQDGLREVNTERLASLHNQVMNLNRLVNDLYELSMSDIGALNYQKESINGVALVTRTMSSLRDEYENKNIAINLDGDNKSILIFADGDRLQQLFVNLMTNSLRYTDEGGELGIKIKELEKSMQVIMEDSAPGVSDDDLTHLFERLYRVDSSRNRKTGGTGLGLAICKNIVDAHEGSISAESSSLGGLKIIIELPKD